MFTLSRIVKPYDNENTIRGYRLKRMKLIIIQIRYQETVITIQNRWKCISQFIITIVIHGHDFLIHDLEFNTFSVGI